MITANIDTTQGPSIIFNSDPNEPFVKKLGTKSLFLSTNSEENKNMEKVYPLIQLWKVTQLSVVSRADPKILSRISHISFPCLKSIVIIGNELQSLESFPRMELPSLQIVYLCGNKIIKINSFSKGVYPRLKEVYLSDNYISDGDMASMRLSSSLEYLSIDYASCQFSDVNWLAKIQSLSLKQLNMKSKQSIKQFKLQQQLRLKYPNIDIYERN